MAHPPQKFLQRLVNRPLIGGLIVGIVSLLVLWLIALKNGMPEPRVQDEFSYLLAADTFSHARVANPTPAGWEHFESPHVLVRPTYMSKYPPGQGVALAIGELLSGRAILGVWLSTAAVTVAIYWMLLGFVSRGWALMGGLVAAVHPQMLDWGQVYWGGAVAVMGAAILVGAAARWRKSPSVAVGIGISLGLLVLANSRPFEGLILSIPIVAAALARRKKWRVLYPAIGVLLIGSILTGYYNFRITGHALRLPTAEYSAQYDVYPKFWFFPKRTTPAYRNDVMRAVHTEWERGDYDRLRSATGFVKISAERVWELLRINAQPIVLLIPLAAGLIWLDGWIWIALGFFILGIWAESWFLPHYAAPLLPVMMVVMVIGWRRLGKIVGVLCIVAFLAGVVIHIASPLPQDSKRVGRVELTEMYPQLQSGRHLIFVQYEPGHLLDDEWVYNGAEIASQNIIWARSLGAAADRELLNLYPNRRVWRLDLGKDQLALTTSDLPADRNLQP